MRSPHQPESATTSADASERHAKELDRRDPLRSYRDLFAIPKCAEVVGPGSTGTPRSSAFEPGEECVYFAGNSLGLMPLAARDAVTQELDDWSRLGVEGHLRAHHPWLPAHEELRENLAGLVGARPHEVVAMNSLTVNLHLMMATFYRPTRERYEIVIEDSAFPSDSYAVQSQAALHGFDPRKAVVRLRARAGEHALRTEDVLAEIQSRSASVALVLLGGVNYLTGQVMQIGPLTEAARKTGAAVGWDLAHGAGNTELNLHEWGPDFACWCSYKYLNSGPGAVAGCFVHERHTTRTGGFGSRSFLARMSGWWGNDPSTRFKMRPDFDPVASADAWALSNPPILSLAPLRVSLDIFARATMPALRSKGRAMTEYLRSLIDDIPGAERFVSIITPSDSLALGSQLSIAVADRPRELLSALHAGGVVCDYREPNVVRVAPVPLYNTFCDCWRFARLLRTHLTAP